jgi:hypothetical protein
MTPLEKKGIAVGQSDVRHDCIVFRFKSEVFEIRTPYSVAPEITYNGYFYTTKVKWLRKIKAKINARELAHG